VLISRTRRAALTAVLPLALLAAGCGGGDADPSTDADPSPSATASGTPTPEPTLSTLPTTAAADGYLPVPSGVTLTKPGTRLELKETAVAAWAPRQDLVGVVDIAVTRIDETTVQASLAGFDLKGDEQRSTPYFVRAKVTNVGETDLGARQVPLYFLDGRGVLLAPTGVARDFEECPGSTLPAVFAPGDETATCLIFLAPEGSTLQSIMFRPPEGIVPLQWTGKVTALEDGKKGGNKADSNKERGQRG
jgi:hypothetical protein